MKRQHTEKAKVWGRLKDATWTPRASVSTRRKNPKHRVATPSARPVASTWGARGKSPRWAEMLADIAGFWLSSDPSPLRCLLVPWQSRGNSMGTCRTETPRPWSRRAEGERPEYLPVPADHGPSPVAIWLRLHPRSPRRGRKWFVF